LTRSALIAAAGAVGALARYHLQVLVSRLHGGTFPLGTLVVNVSGCLLLGLVAGVATDRFGLHGDARAAITVGLLGAYTTFSTFALETDLLVEYRSIGLAVLNVVLSITVGLVAVRLGLRVGRAL
jgi:CrcB protein